MPPAPTRDEHIADITRRYMTDLKSFEEASNRVMADLRDTMRNIALSSGAIAAAALVLLSSNIPTDPIFVLIGIITLMVESVLAFGWLIHVQTDAGQRILKQRHETLSPASKIITSYHEFQSGLKTQGTFDEELAVYIRLNNEKARENHEQDVQASPKKRDYWDRVFVGTLIFGVLFLGLGLVAPHMPGNPFGYKAIESNTSNSITIELVK